MKRKKNIDDFEVVIGLAQLAIVVLLIYFLVFYWK